MNRTHLLPLLALIAMGCPRKDPGPKPVDPSFEITETSSTIQVPFSGCISEPVTLTTDEGVTLTLDAGTCLTTIWGERLTGDVTLTLGPATDVPELETLAGRTFHGAVEVSAALGMPSGPPLDVEAAFDPPASIDMSSVLDGYEGTWTLNGFGADPTSWQNAPASLRARPPGEPPADKTWVSIPITNVDDGSTHTTFVPVSQVTGADLSDPDIPADGETVEGDIIHEQEIGEAGSEWPKVGSVTIIGTDTAIIHSLTQWVPGLHMPGQRRIVDAQGREDAFEIKIVERDGKRYVQVVSSIKNELRVRVCFNHEDGSSDCVTGDSSGASENEEDRDGEYIGRVQIIIRGCFSFDTFYDDIRPLMSDAVGDDFVFSPKGSFDESGGAQVSGTTGFRPGSTQDLADQLANDLPPGWDIQAGNRIILITIPCAPPKPVITDYGASLLQELSDVDYTIVDTVGPLAVQPESFVVSNKGVAVVAGVDTLELVDLETNQGLGTVPVAGLISAIAPGPFGQTCLVAHSGGDLMAIDYQTTEPVFSIPLPQGEDYTDISVADDGTFAYVTSPTLGRVLEIDLVRHMPTVDFPIPNLAAAAVSHDGRTLAAVDAMAGSVILIELGTMLSPLDVPTGNGPVRAFWPSSDDGVIVSNPADGTVTFVDRSAGSTLQVPTAQGATAITEANDGAGSIDILVGNVNNNSLSVLPYTDISTMPTVATSPGFNQPTVLRTRNR